MLCLAILSVARNAESDLCLVFLTTPQVTFTPSTLAPEVTILTGTEDKLTVGTLNVENLDPNDSATKFDALARIVVTNMKSPDILSVEEVQDNNGAPTGNPNDGVVDADRTLNLLITNIIGAGGPQYQYRQVSPVFGTNGGEPGGNIRVAFLFNPARVSFVDRPGGNSTTAVAVNSECQGGGVAYCTVAWRLWCPAPCVT
jgi:hypothetical protein